MTDERGAYVLEDLAPGRYTVAVERRGYYRSESVTVPLHAGFESVLPPIALRPCSSNRCASDNTRVLPVTCEQVRIEAERLFAERRINMQRADECSDCFRIESARVITPAGQRINNARRALREYTTADPAWYIHYGPLGFGGALQLAQSDPGCRTQLEFHYSSFGILLIPIDGDDLSFDSNLRLESAYLDELSRRVSRNSGGLVPSTSR